MRLTVVSPHLDDAVLSIGATISGLGRGGNAVTVVSVFAGDPEATTPASYWDASRGDTQGAAARQRRVEDADALGELGASAVALPFSDSGYVAARDPDAIWAQLGPIVESSDTTLLPGWPLGHADHRYATMLVLERVSSEMPIVFYAEQPYASSPVTLVKGVLRNRTTAPLRHAYGAGVRWSRQRLDRTGEDDHRRALARYAGELQNLGPRAVMGKLGRRLSGEWLGVGDKVALPPTLLLSAR